MALMVWSTMRASSRRESSQVSGVIESESGEREARTNKLRRLFSLIIYLSEYHVDFLFAIQSTPRGLPCRGAMGTT